MAGMSTGETSGAMSSQPQGADTAELPVFHGVVPLTMVDFPGKIALTAYTLGCNLRCPICHNRDLALSLADGLPEHGIEAVLEHIRGRSGWIDGVCVTGGEPLLHRWTRDALRRFKQEGLAVKLDTNGCYPDRLEECLRAGLVDYVAMDVKAPLREDEYSRATGVAAGKWLPRIRESLSLIMDSGLDYEFRTICVPGLHTPESIGEIARELAPCRRYILRAFRPVNTLDPEYEAAPPPTVEEMLAYLAAAREYMEEVLLDEAPADVGDSPFVDGPASAPAGM